MDSAIWVLKNHVFFDPEIDLSISARDVWTGDAGLRASSSAASPNSFFIGVHGEELSIPRNSTLTKIPINTGIGSPS